MSKQTIAVGQTMTLTELPKSLQLINESNSISLPINWSINPQDIQDASTLALKGKSIVGIADKESNDAGGAVVRDMRVYCKSVEIMRAVETKPLLEAQRLVKFLVDTHLAPLYAEITRIEKMGTAFLEAENHRVEAEIRKQREEFEAAQRRQFELDDAVRKAAKSGGRLAQFEANKKLEAAKEVTAAIIAAPEPEAVRARGQSIKQVLKWEVTDLMLLVKHNPQLCSIEPKASAINSTCNPALPIPGLKLWYENKSTFSTR